MTEPTSCLLPENVEKITIRDGAPHSVTKLDPTSTALVIVDMQNFYMKERASSYCPAAQAIVPNVNRLADAVRRFGSPVLWLRNVTTAEAFKGWSHHYERMTRARIDIRKRELAKDGEGFRLWHEMDVRETDRKIEKTRYSAFIPGASNLEKILGEYGVDSLIFCGVATNVCVESTARDAMMMNYRTVIVEDACAANSKEAHEVSLNTLYLNFGDVQTTDQIIGLMGVDKAVDAAE
ncbi:MAG: cysteine hydrolase [Proteobacteria bacterium]|nr:cysteine hydrolase [Pseudomonadota bacterium]MDA1326850.1 cysteine hydrolase [Pseudomonadota bacterium]